MNRRFTSIFQWFTNRLSPLTGPHITHHKKRRFWGSNWFPSRWESFDFLKKEEKREVSGLSGGSQSLSVWLDVCVNGSVNLSLEYGRKTLQHNLTATEIDTEMDRAETLLSASFLHWNKSLHHCGVWLFITTEGGSRWLVVEHRTRFRFWSEGQACEARNSRPRDPFANWPNDYKYRHILCVVGKSSRPQYVRGESLGIMRPKQTQLSADPPSRRTTKNI